MTAVVAAGRRVLPRGWTDFGRQLAIWFGFYFAYLGARSFADRNPAQAFWNGWRVLSFEQRTTHAIVETTTQQIVNSSHALLTAPRGRTGTPSSPSSGSRSSSSTSATTSAFARFRNTVLLANVIGLVGYVVWPTAPPWMFTTYFQDGVNHSNGALAALANPYAAMPSLHAADALIVGVFLVSLCRRWWAKAALGALAGLGLVLRPRDGEPLPARRRGRDRRRARSRLWAVRQAPRLRPLIANLL